MSQPTTKKTLVVKRPNEETIEFYVRTEVIAVPVFFIACDDSGVKPEPIVIPEPEDNFLGNANHDEHGWNGMETVESLMHEFADALGIEVIEEESDD